MIKKELYPCSVEMAKKSGFCRGVARAVERAYDLLEQWPARRQLEQGGTALCMFGEVIHNRVVVEELLERGMTLCNTVEEVPENSTVLIRAHGLPPQTIEALREKACVIENTTCGYVTKIHRLAMQAVAEGKTPILLGNPKHPEVVGINGASEGKCLIFSSVEQVEAYEFPEADYVLLSQTTFSRHENARICEVLEKKVASLKVFATICEATENRQIAAEDLAGRVDVMFIIGSEHSSNTKKLLEVCQRVCGENYLVETPETVRQLLQQGQLRQKRVGVTAGASSPESIIREVFHIMSEHVNETVNEVVEPVVEAQVETSEVLVQEEPATVAVEETGEISFTDAIDSIPQLKRGATVKGSIVRYDADFVYVDVRDKSEGKINLREFADFDLEEAVREHREIDVYVRSIRNTDMGKEILLSKARVDFGKYKGLVEEAFKSKTPITVKVTNVVKDGVIASYGGIDIYIHRTQLETGIVQDLEPYRNQEIEIVVTQFDPERRRLRVAGSRRQLLNRDRKAKAEELWNGIEIGDVYEGVVRSLTDFGAFVDIGGVDGLVHISELSWDRIKHPSEVVQVGDVVQVYIKEFDKEAKRIKLGYKRIEDDPYHNIEERFPVGSIVHGKVMRMLNFGVFIEIAEGVDAFCHISQISTTRLNKPDDVLKVGMEVDARVIDVKNGEHRIGVSIRDVAPIDPERSEEEQPVRERKPRRNREDEMPTSYSDQTAHAGSSAFEALGQMLNQNDAE